MADPILEASLEVPADDRAARDGGAPYAHVAACVDRSEAAARGLGEAARLRALGAGRLSVVHVARAPAPLAALPWGRARRALRPGAGRWLDEAAVAVAGEPVLLWGRPAERVLAWARAEQPDLLVAGSGAGPLERAAMGSFARRVAVAAPCPALILPPRVVSPGPPPGGGAYGHIACCVDESPASERALAEAMRLRALGPGRLSLVHAAPRPLLRTEGPGGPEAAPEDIAAADAAWLRSRAARVRGAEPVLVTGQAAAAVREWAGAAGPDLMVAAAHRGPVERALLGSFTRALAASAPCPVLVTR